MEINEIKNFSDLIQNIGIDIPLIQRDYVQGRDHTTELEKIKSERINKDILRNLMVRYTDERDKRDRFANILIRSLLEPETKSIELNFIYGTVENVIRNNNDDRKSFLPLDGQQRLTTLFLLSWVLLPFAENNVNTDVFEKFKSGLRNIRYNTRPSADDFCRNLFSENVCNMYREMVLPTGDIHDIRETIENQSWFVTEWIKDPTVLSMLQMLNAIEEILSQCEYDSMEKKSTIAKNLLEGKGVRFDVLNMEDLKLKDSLYIQMNARGKQLTDFENWKSEFIKMLEEKYTHSDGTNNLQESVLYDLPLREDSVSYLGGNVSLLDYFKYSIEHQWTDLFWGFCKEEIKKHEEILAANHGTLSKLEMDCYPVIDRFFMNTFRNIHELFYFTVNLETGASAFTDSKPQRDATFGMEKTGVENVKRLFRFLDLLKEFEEKDLYNELFYKTEGNAKLYEDGKVRLFDGKNINLFVRCAKDFSGEKNYDVESTENAEFNNMVHIILYAMLCYAEKYGCEPDDNFKSFIRKVRNKVESITYQRSANVAITNTLKIVQIYNIKNDIQAYMENRTPMISKEESSLQDLNFFYGHIPEGLLDASDNFTSSDILETLKAWDALEDNEDKTRVLIAYGYEGRTVDLSIDNRKPRFFGSKGRWKNVFMNLNEADNKNIVDTIRAITVDYVAKKSEGLSGVDLLKEMLQDKINAVACSLDHNFYYYILKYDSFLKATATSTPTHYFLFKDLEKLDIRSIQCSSRPLLAYHTEPFVYSVANKLINDNNENTEKTLYLKFVSRGNYPVVISVFDSKTAKNPIGEFQHVVVDGKNNTWKFVENRGIADAGVSQSYVEGYTLIGCPQADIIEKGVRFVKHKYPGYKFARKQ